MGLEKNISPQKITLEQHVVYTITQEEKIIQIRNSKNSTGKVEKAVEHDARIA